ncbi:unnamed protein product [Moneuplotes crassus]|uniref:Uncharacterized protein n=1 Tax=Euplotes crassus TaxID=5936 RepID=A0AAD1UMV6_EUPCR|nr:unnamed protein product [Moneuplotes crassus]
MLESTSWSLSMVIVCPLMCENIKGRTIPKMFRKIKTNSLLTWSSGINEG